MFRAVESPARPLDASPGPIDGVLPVERLPLGARPRRGSAPFQALSERVTPTAVLVVGLPVVGLLMLMTAANVAGQVGLWDNAHRTAAGIVATLVAASSVRRATGFDRRLRMLISVGCGFWLISQLGWDLEVALGIATFPGPSDVARLLTVIPANLALLLVVRRRVRRLSRAFYIDSATILLAITALVVQAFGDHFAPQGGLVALVSVAYPTLYLATAGVGLMALLAVRAELRLTGGYLLLAAFAVLGYTWVAWLRQTAGAYPDPGSLVSYGFSLGILGVGIATAVLRVRDMEDNRSSRATTVAQIALPLLALLVSVSLIETPSLRRPAPWPGRPDRHWHHRADGHPPDGARAGARPSPGHCASRAFGAGGCLAAPGGHRRALPRAGRTHARRRVYRRGGLQCHRWRAARLHEPAMRVDPRLHTGGVHRGP